MHTDLEEKHINELVNTIKKRHNAPKITNIYPIYHDMVKDLKENCKVSSSNHKKVVAIGALQRIFTANDEKKQEENMKVIEHHEQTIEYLLHKPVIREDACERCKKSCTIC